MLPNVGVNAVAGSPGPSGQEATELVSYSEMRAGAYDPDERLQDMDSAGVYSLRWFEPFLAGFGDVRTQTTLKELDFSLAMVRARNDWIHDEWAGTSPVRFILTQLPWLQDLMLLEARRSAAAPSVASAR
ncbi:hypothetical protein [Rhodococcus rhodochrous]|uniref:hypothetical protein n=1 Tax=Rhodococcus rhodochrous TaxID=1829 RepID=UPI000474D490|nr:hypothetical protein [Rhodococcus rhodochrous]